MFSNYTWTTGSDKQGQIEISDPGQISDCLIGLARKCNTVYALSRDSYQPVHMPSLVRVFTDDRVLAPKLGA